MTDSRLIIVTGTVRPFVNSIRHIDPSAREVEYVVALEDLIGRKFSRGAKIVFLENSGTKLVTSETVAQHIAAAEITNTANITYYEIEMLRAYFENADIRDNTIVTKLTGRYIFENLDVYPTNCNFAIDFYPAAFSLGRGVLSSLISMTCKHWRDFLAQQDQIDKEMVFEHRLWNYISRLNPRSIRLPYPKIVATSGTHGVPYRSFARERTRVLLARYLRFGYTWE